MNCCIRATPTSGTPLFSRVIAVDLYDGPTAAIAECDNCAAAYGLRMEAWDDAHIQRVFRACRLPPGSFDEAIAAFADAGPPRWPE